MAQQSPIQQDNVGFRSPRFGPRANSFTGASTNPQGNLQTANEADGALRSGTDSATSVTEPQQPQSPLSRINIPAQQQQDPVLSTVMNVGGAVAAKAGGDRVSDWLGGTNQDLPYPPTARPDQPAVFNEGNSGFETGGDTGQPGTGLGTQSNAGIDTSTGGAAQLEELGGADQVSGAPLEFASTDAAVGGGEAAVGGEVAGETAGEVGGEIGGEVALDSAAEIGGEAALGGELAAEGGALAAGEMAAMAIPYVGIVIAVFMIISSASVICTELRRQGLLERDLYLTHLQYPMKDRTMRGYRWWGDPCVRLMKRRPWATRLARVIVRSRAIYLRHRVKPEKKSSFFGWLVHRTVMPACWCIGLVIDAHQVARNFFNRFPKWRYS